MMPSQPCSPISLPYEVRTLIYDSIIGLPPPSIIIFYNGTTRKTNCNTSNLPTAWLRTCRLIHAEGWSLVASLAMVVWSVHGSGDPFVPTPRNQLSDVLSSTFLRKLRSLEVMQGCLAPTRELLEMWDLRSLTLHVLHREKIKDP